MATSPPTDYRIDPGRAVSMTASHDATVQTAATSTIGDTALPACAHASLAGDRPADGTLAPSLVNATYMRGADNDLVPLDST